MDVPMIDITVQWMGNKLQSHMVEYLANRQEEIKAAIELAVKNYNFQEDVREIVGKSIRENFKKEIDWCIQRALDEPQVRQELNNLMINALRTYLTNRNIIGY